MKKTTQELEAALLYKGRPRLQKADMLKTGSTVLDLALSGRREGGLAKGFYFWMCGDSASGKTFLTLTCMAEASINPSFAKHRLIYDANEDGALMDLRKFFGPAMAKRIEAPTKEGPSTTIGDFYYNLDDALDDGRPFIYLLDSMDGLTTKYAEAKFQAAKKADRGGREAKGDYGDGKAKTNSTRIRSVVRRLQGTENILIILSQTRDNIDAGLFEEQQTTAGGRALKFYAAAQLWSSVGSRIKKQHKGRDVVIGVNCRIKVKKNRLTGREWTAEVPIYYEHGMDDIGGMVDFLVHWKAWPKSKAGKIDCTSDFDFVGDHEAVCRYIDTEGLREDLEDITEASWREVQKALANKVQRTRKYG